MTAKQPQHSVKQIKLLSEAPDITREPRFRVKIIKNNQMSQNMIMLSLERPPDFKFNPGQYIWVVLPECSKFYGVIDRKAYSMSSEVNSPTLEVLIRLTSSEFSGKIKKLKVGDDVDIIGPMGSAFLTPVSGAVMISDGSGISPFLSILKSHVAEKLSLIAYSANEGQPIHCENELQKLSKKYGYQISCKKTGPQPSDFSHLRKDDERPIFISGSQGFVNLVTNIFSERGFPKKRLRYEGNYPQTKETKATKEMFNELFYSDWSNNSTRAQKLIGFNDLLPEIFKQSSNYVLLTDYNGNILLANQSCINATGYTTAEMKGHTARLWGGLMPDYYNQEMWRSLRKGIPVKRLVVNRRRNGSIYTAIATITPILHKGIFFATEENITTLREVDRAKTEFISVASHQLRTPLSVVNWYAEMLLAGDTSKLSPQQIEYLHEIYSSNQRMVTLVNALLDVSHIGLGTFVIKSEPINIVELTQSVINEQKIKINEKHLNFSFSSKDQIPIIQTDPKFLTMIIQNILSNAIKYTPDEGKISIKLSLFKKTNILLTVSDNGYGIPKAQHDKIFTKFFRADNVKLKSTEGSGLGLYIVKSVVENFGGTVWFESEEDKGTTFSVLLPMGSLTKKEGQEADSEKE